MQAEAPVRAMPYPSSTAAGLPNRARRVALDSVKDANALTDPVAVESQSTASLNKKGT